MVGSAKGERGWFKNPVCESFALQRPQDSNGTCLHPVISLGFRQRCLSLPLALSCLPTATIPVIPALTHLLSFMLRTVKHFGQQRPDPGPQNLHARPHNLCIYIYISHIHIDIDIDIHIDVHIHIHIHTYIHTYVHVYIYIYMYI